MLILTSNGISSDNLFIKTKRLIHDQTKSAALITTASTFHQDKAQNIQRHTDVIEKLGLTVDLFDIASQSPSVLAKYDMVYLMGGNPCYLLSIMRQTHCQELFRSYIRDKIVIGASAGSVVFGTTIEYLCELEPTLNDRVQLTDFTGLNLTNIHIFPHVSRVIHVFDNCLERTEDYEIRNRLHLHYIEDGQGIFLYDNEHVIV